MRTLSLDIHGVPVRLEASQPSWLDGPARDFGYFTAPAIDAAVTFRVEGTVPPLPAGRPSLSTRHWRAWDGPARRFIAYPDGSAACYDYARRVGSIHAQTPERRHELSTLAVLSRAGEELDRRGWHRVHALGFVSAGAAGCVLLPSGGGKSVLSLALLQETNLSLLSDDTPLVGPGGVCRAWPTPLGFAPSYPLSGICPRLVTPFPRLRHGLKKQVALDYFRDRVTAEAPLRWLILGRRHDGPPRWHPISRFRALAALGTALVLGAGVAQMAEYMVGFSPHRLGTLTAIAASRAQLAARLAARARCLELFLGPEAAENARAVERLTRET